MSFLYRKQYPLNNFLCIISLFCSMQTAISQEFTGTAVTIIRKSASSLNSATKTINIYQEYFQSVSKGDTPPTKSTNLQIFIDEMKSIENSIRDMKLYNSPKYVGDYSITVQNDCDRHETVLPIYQKFQTEYTAFAADILPKIPDVTNGLRELSSNLSERLKAADDLTKLYAGLAGSPVQAVRDFYGWAFLDMTTVSKAIAEARNEVDKKYKNYSEASSRIQKNLADAKRVTVEYAARIPVMNKGCASRR